MDELSQFIIFIFWKKTGVLVISENEEFDIVIYNLCLRKAPNEEKVCIFKNIQVQDIVTKTVGLILDVILRIKHIRQYLKSIKGVYSYTLKLGRMKYIY